MLEENVNQYIKQIRRGLRPKWRRASSRSRTRPHYRLWPMLRIAFFEGGRRVHGSNDSPVRVYLDKGVLRITLPVAFEEARYLAEQGWAFDGRALARRRFRLVKSQKNAVIEVRLQLSTLRELRRLIAFNCEFTCQLVCKKRPAIHIIAKRKEVVKVKLPALVIGCDLNSRYGLVVRGFEVTEADAKLAYRRRFRPPNHGFRRRLAAELQSMGKYKEANAVGRREGALNRAWEKGIIAELRKVVRSYVERGYSVIIAIDVPDADSLRNSSLQGTLLRVVKRLRWMCGFEGSIFVEVRVSGRKCPLCGEKGVEYEPRKYRCKKCGIKWQRDSLATILAAISSLQKLSLDGAVKTLKGWLREKATRLKDLSRI